MGHKLIIKGILNSFLFKYIHDKWNIGIADIGDDLSPINIKWLKHSYQDRWFADPFIVDETTDSFIVLVEEYLRDDRKGRISRLTVSKHDGTLLDNETLLNLPTHLSFPIFIDIDGKRYVYPENSESGRTMYYEFDGFLHSQHMLSNLPLSDAVILPISGQFYLLYTTRDDCNGNLLKVSRSEKALSGYNHYQDVLFRDNIARRAGRFFYWRGHCISPAQVCNGRYGEGISLQEVNLEDGCLKFREIKRMYPCWSKYNKAFHTYNVWGDKVVIDGVTIGWPTVSRIYRRVRSLFI